MSKFMKTLATMMISCLLSIMCVSADAATTANTNTTTTTNTAVSSTDLQSAAGYWVTWNEKTGKPGSIIKIWNDNGVFAGKVYKILPNGGKSRLYNCEKCQGAQKGAPILGLTIVSKMVLDKGKYRNGRVLDPRSGKVYKAEMWLIDKGHKLKLRGYIGLPVFGQTRVWTRVTEQKANEMPSAKDTNK